MRFVVSFVAPAPIALNDSLTHSLSLSLSLSHTHTHTHTHTHKHTHTHTQSVVGSEAWVLKKREEQRLEAAQMKFLRNLLGITKLDKEKNRCIRRKTGAQNIVKEIKQYQKKWLQHVQRMDTNILPRQALKYRPEGRRNIGRPQKRWRDQLHFED